MKVKKLSLLLALMLLTACIFAGCGDSKEEAAKSEEGGEITVLAAASLTDALNEIITEYNKDCKDKIKTSYAGSGDLVQQIKGNAPCDLFISASKKNMDELEEADFIDKESRKDLLGNTLTLIATKEAAGKVTMDALTTDAVKQIAIGEPETVPAGKYATQVFENMKITDKVEKKIVKAKDVRAVLNYVETGNVECGFVYKTDAMLLDKDKGEMVAEVKDSLHDPIVYPAAIMKDSQQAEAAENFYKFIQEDYAKGVFEKYGFTVK
ncbi:molybdate ABC transporter substrate-binding protein [Anaerovorax odorimutans]|uniref:Molybdate ABC transporter substrate-binding protein n=1 Tax=Anaerovorax odorimutans TaxID=109327 RepID=A0ABT1RPI3_9FIRM|nr:molybdate ABC transporter substrate-binding protein [Anaerovorax odorimutans]MCQ4637080.1 molybdate ABC transporter substrate-binding protein [Anaerovorax odorimutans]